MSKPIKVLNHNEYRNKENQDNQLSILTDLTSHDAEA